MGNPKNKKQKMDLISWNVKLPLGFPSSLNCTSTTNIANKKFFCGVCNYPLHFHNDRNNSSPFVITHAKKKKDSQLELQPSIIKEVSEDDDEDDDDFVEDDNLITDGFDDDDDGDYFEEDYAAEDQEISAGDGAEGGGISFAGTSWDKEALTIAENVIDSFDDDLGIYAFRTLVNATIQVRIEKLSTKSGSPSMSDIEAFSEAYRARLDEAEIAKTMPENISLEVSSPGVERVIRIPQELDRFKERPMSVKYVVEAGEGSCENDGVFRLVSYDLETRCCTWGLADVRINREKAGKGRPMSKKQREWRVTTPFDSIRLARLYSEI